MKSDLPKLDEDGFARAVSSLSVGHTLIWYGGAVFFGLFLYYTFRTASLLPTIDGDDFGMRAATVLILRMLASVGFLVAFAVMAVGANMLKAQLLMLRDPSK